ncbi:MAG: hypothetical protein KatS3mg057_0938 [Herpetosiphonaceae bacterium]|nr:MAG: hypothetical protein KatS3mg057_0938 [Herpetosiphonaceae bacterium]
MIGRFRARLSGLYYGWPIALALSITELTSWGILYYAFAVVLVPLEQELGWSRAETTGAFSLALLLSGIAAVPIGRWIDRYGSRGVMTLGSLAGVLLVYAWSRVERLVDRGEPAARHAVSTAVVRRVARRLEPAG